MSMQSQALRFLTTPETKTNESNHCVSCGRQLDAATHLKGHKPKVGDLSVCMYCGATAAFDERLILRELTPEEFAALPASLRDEIERTQSLCGFMMGLRKYGVDKK